MEHIPPTDKSTPDMILHPEDSLRKALGLLLTGDSSNLPVVDDKDSPVGVVNLSDIKEAARNHYGGEESGARTQASLTRAN